MSDENVIPTGYLKVTVDVDDSIKNDIEIYRSLSYIRSSIAIYSEEDKTAQKYPVRIGEVQIFPLKPGLYRVKAVLGDLHSDYLNVEIKTGEITGKKFHFGMGS
jgi:hypothetical protein